MNGLLGTFFLARRQPGTAACLFALAVLLAFATLQPAAAQTITFTFANGTVTDDGYAFDVMAAADEVLAGTPIGDTQVYVNYNPAAFTAGAAGATVTEGALMADVDGLDAHTIVNVADNTPERLAITTDYIVDGNAAFSTALTTEPQQLLHVVLAISDHAQSAGLSFEQGLMDGQQYDANGQAINGVEAFDADGSTLPVDLASFQGTRDGDTVLLRWETTSETNNAGFEVQRRRQAADWETLAFVDGRGTSTETHLYQHRVDAVEPGRHVFRLKQVDFDGSATYSAEVEVNVTIREAFVLEPAYPNPFNPRTTLRFAVREDQPVRLELFDVLGQRLRVLYEGVPEAGVMQQAVVDGSGLAGGLYLVRLSGDGVLAQQRIVLAK